VHLLLFVIAVLHSHRHNKTSLKNHDDKRRRLDAPVQTLNPLQLKNTQRHSLGTSYLRQILCLWMTANNYQNWFILVA
jgi:hypothetical protein